MPILPNRIQKNGSTLNAQISPSDEPLYSPLPFMLLPDSFQRGDGLQRGWNVDRLSTACLWRSPLCRAAQPRHLSIPAPPFNGQKGRGNWKLGHCRIFINRILQNWSAWSSERRYLATVTSNDSGFLSLFLRSLKIRSARALHPYVIKSGLGSF